MSNNALCKKRVWRSETSYTVYDVIQLMISIHCGRRVGDKLGSIYYIQSIAVTILKKKDKSDGSKSECRPDTQM